MNFAIGVNTKKDSILVHNFSFFDFFRVFIDFFDKLATPDLLKIKIFQNKAYGVINLDYDVTNKLLLHDSNYVVDVVK